MEEIEELMPTNKKAPLIHVLQDLDSDLHRMLMAVLEVRGGKRAIHAQEHFTKDLIALVTNYYKVFKKEYSEKNMDLLEENILNLMAMTYLSELMDPIMVVERNYATPDANGKLKGLIAKLETKGIKHENLSIPYVILGYRDLTGALGDMVGWHDYVVIDDKQFERRAVDMYSLPLK